MSTMLEKQAQRRMGPRHAEAFETSSFLSVEYRRMYRPMAAKIAPRRVTKALHEAGIVGVLLGTHGVGGWRSQARATKDVDVLIRTKDHSKAVGAIHAAFPKLEVRDTPVVTRFVDPKSQEPLIDLMKPIDDLLKCAFRYSEPVGITHRVPDLEMALVTKFAAMVSPYRKTSKKLIDAGDFADIVETHMSELDMGKLKRLAAKVYAQGAAEIVRLIDDIKTGKKLVI